MNYFEVTAKCGHVGKGQYYKALFYVRAKNGKDATVIVRKRPHVKHDHKDAILAVVEVDYAAYTEGRKEYWKAPYFKCRNKQEQRLILPEVVHDIHCERDSVKQKVSGRKAKLVVMLRY